MKVLAVGAALAAALVTGGLLAGPAFAVVPAQPPAPNSGCGAALLALSNAEKAAADATAADKAADDAQEADDALANANAALAAARAAALAGGATPTDLTDGGSTLRATKQTILDQPGDPSQEDVDKIAVIDAKLALINTFLVAQTKAAAALVAAGTNAAVLRGEANKTNAVELAADATKANTAADRACGNNNPGAVRFENCDQVRNAGLAPLRFDQPGYRVGLDADRDGMACEVVENTVTPTPAAPVAPRIPTAIDTGFTP